MRKVTMRSHEQVAMAWRRMRTAAEDRRPNGCLAPPPLAALNNEAVTARRRQRGGSAAAERRQSGDRAEAERRQRGGRAATERRQSGDRAATEMRQSGGRAAAERRQQQVVVVVVSTHQLARGRRVDVIADAAVAAVARARRAHVRRHGGERLGALCLLPALPVAATASPRERGERVGALDEADDSSTP